ncbi:MAG: CapA family protein, partial [Anaerolineae bacterium]
NAPAVLVACTAATETAPTTSPVHTKAAAQTTDPNLNPAATAPPSPTADPTVTVIIGGDVIEQRYGTDAPFPPLVETLGGVLPLMQTGDVVVFNAEGGLCDPVALSLGTRGTYNFYLTPESLVALNDRLPGDLVLVQANNHTMNFGEACRDHGEGRMAAAGIHVVGAGDDLAAAREPALIEVNGSRIAVLAYAATQIIPYHWHATPDQPGILPMDTDTLAADLAALPPDTFAVVVMHAAFEYTFRPEEGEVRFAEAAVQNGADLVVGHGPHVVQNPVTMDGVPVFYSLGNALMDMCFNDAVKTSQWLSVTIRAGQLVGVSVHPYFAEACMQPLPVGG